LFSLFFKDIIPPAPRVCKAWASSALASSLFVCESSPWPQLGFECTCTVKFSICFYIDFKIKKKRRKRINLGICTAPTQPKWAQFNLAFASVFILTFKIEKVK
jgi:hypothetical protein